MHRVTLRIGLSKLSVPIARSCPHFAEKKPERQSPTKLSSERINLLPISPHPIVFNTITPYQSNLTNQKFLSDNILPFLLILGMTSLIVFIISMTTSHACEADELQEISKDQLAVSDLKQLLDHKPQGQKAVFISYAWDQEDKRIEEESSKRIAKKIEGILLQEGVLAIRDENVLNWNDDINSFMSEVIKHPNIDRIILILSDRYLKRDNCTFELHHLMQRIKQENIYIIKVETETEKIGSLDKYRIFWKGRPAKIDLESKIQDMETLFELTIKHKYSIASNFQEDLMGFIESTQDRISVKGDDFLYDDILFEACLDQVYLRTQDKFRMEFFREVLATTFEKTRVCVNKNLHAFIGLTGSAKSSLISLLEGSTMEIKYDKLGNAEELIVEDPKVKIGGNVRSETVYPSLYNESGLDLWDGPGLEDTRGEEFRLATYVGIDQSIRKAANLASLVAVVKWKDMIDIIASGIRPVSDMMDTIFDEFDNPQKTNNLVVVITHCPKAATKEFFLEKIAKLDKRMQREFLPDTTNPQISTCGDRIVKAVESFIDGSLLTQLYKKPPTKTELNIIKMLDFIQKRPDKVIIAHMNSETKDELKAILENNRGITMLNSPTFIERIGQSRFRDLGDLCAKAFEDSKNKQLLLRQLIAQNKRNLTSQKKQTDELKATVAGDTQQIQFAIATIEQENQELQKNIDSWNQDIEQMDQRLSAIDRHDIYAEIDRKKIQREKPNMWHHEERTFDHPCKYYGGISLEAQTGDAGENLSLTIKDAENKAHCRIVGNYLGAGSIHRDLVATAVFAKCYRVEIESLQQKVETLKHSIKETEQMQKHNSNKIEKINKGKDSIATLKKHIAFGEQEISKQQEQCQQKLWKLNICNQLLRSQKRELLPSIKILQELGIHMPMVDALQARFNEFLISR
jgi:hypothetical protein